MLNKCSDIHTESYFRLSQVIHVFLLILFVLTGIVPNVGAQTETPLANTENDSLAAIEDSLVKSEKEPPLSSMVNYDAQDSMIIDIEAQKAYLFGSAVVKYEDIELTAGYIEIDFKKNLVYAEGVEDSTGQIVEQPVFTESGKEYQAGSMTYNMESKKGRIKEAFTQEGEGYIHGETIKRHSEDVFFIKNGKYTTCNLDHPHYYIKAGKLKIINNNKIVTGPANMWISDVPTPLAVPFGFFPNKNERQSGIIIPAYGSSADKGFNLRNGGYYFGVSDNFDAALTGDIYTNLSWSTYLRSSYRKRYKHNGNLAVEYTNSKSGDPETPDFTQTTSFFVRWKHAQDPKARPYSSFNASVNAGNTNNFRNNFNTSATDYLSNTFKSNISYTKRFANSPFTLTANASHSQNSLDSSITVTAPHLTMTMSRIYPFKKNIPTANRGFAASLAKNFGFSLTSEFQNTVTTNQEDFFNPSTLNKMRNGFRHSIPFSSSAKIGFINVSPRVTLNETWYFSSTRETYDSEAGEAVLSDTVAGFERYSQVTGGVELSTKIYGMYTLKKTRVKAVRHTFTPNVSFNYTPDNSRYTPELFGTVQIDSTGATEEYGYLDNQIWRGPGSYRQAIVRFNFQNTLEMKYQPKSDTAETLKKATLLDAFNFSTQYDIFADSLNWSPVSIDARTNIGKFLTIRAGATLDPYAINENGRRTNTAQYEIDGSLFRLTQVTSSLTLNLQSKDKKETSEKRDEQLSDADKSELENVSENPDAYVDFRIPWSINLTYSITYNRNGLEEDVINSLNFSGDVNVTDNWKVGYRSGLDFETGQLTYTSIDIYRDLHCWQIRFNAIPFGARQQYTFDIHVKASVLQDLKLQRKRNWFDYQ